MYREMVLVTRNWRSAPVLMVLVPNQTGCPPGIFSRSLCMEQSLRFGSMLPYIDKAIKKGFAVVVCNPDPITDKFSSSGKRKKVRGSLMIDRYYG